MKDYICLDELAKKGNKTLFEKLKSLKREVFPDEYRLEVDYNFDIINNVNYPGKFLTFFVESLAKIDIPTFFVEIKTSYRNIDRDLTTLDSLYNNGKILHKKSNFDFNSIKNSNDTFCILPWVHFYFNPQGKILPCCVADEKFDLGTYTNKNVDFNNEKIRELRKNMINNAEVPHCKTCYEKEKNNIKSFRQQSNKTFSKDIDTNNLFETVENFKLKYLDIRLSNVCNLKCRMCSGKFSNRIAKEDFDIWGSTEYAQNSNFLDHETYFLDLVKNHVDSLEEIYFAGGEPLINPVHYKILDFLIEKNNINLRISYNTNFSILKYKNNDVLEYWKKFKNIEVGASIDLIGEASNYVRNGVSYKTLEKNYLELKKQCPEIKFSITSVLSMFNAFNLCELQKHWIEKNNLSANNLSFNILVSPSNMSLKCLPLEYKNKVSKKINVHIDFLEKIRDAEDLISKWKNAIEFMFREDHSYMLESFFKANDLRDMHRNQFFEDYFPEYKNLRLNI